MHRVIKAVSKAVRFARPSSTSTAPLQSRVLRANEIPGPKRLPFFGISFDILFKYGIPKFHIMWADIHKDYGPFVLARNLGQEYYSLSDPKLIEQVYQALAQTKYPAPIAGTELMANYEKVAKREPGILVAEGEKWYQQRTAANKHFLHPTNVDLFVPSLGAVSRQFVEYIEKQIQENPDPSHPRVVPHLEKALSRLTTESVSTVLLDRPLGALNTDNSTPPEVEQFMQDASRVVGLQIDLMLKPPLYKVHPSLSSLYTRWSKMLDRIYSTALSEINLFLERSNSPDYVPPKHIPIIKTLFDKTTGGEKRITTDQASSVFITALFGGTDTSSVTLGWLFYALSTNPEVQEKLYREIIEVAGKDSIPTAEQLKRMPYLRDVVRENFRMYPVLPQMSKEVEKDLELEWTSSEGFQTKFTIPARKMIVLQHWIAGMDQKNWGNFDANKFIPERFREDHSSFIVLPFGAGARNCLGQRIALTEIYLTTVAVLQKYKLDWAAEDHPTAVWGGLSRHSIPLKIAFLPRN